MRAKIYIFLFLALSACTTPSPEEAACLKAMENLPPPTVAHDMTLALLIGRPAAEITSVEGYASIRVLKPNSMMTMDYRLDRINLHTDCEGIILSATKG